MTNINLRAFAQKIMRRLRKEGVQRLRNRKFYPALYPSWWHSQLSKPTDAIESNYLVAFPNPGAGIGHQIANVLAGIWYAGLFGLRRAHEPFPSAEWETLLGLGQGVEHVSHLVNVLGYSAVSLPMFDEFNPASIRVIRNIINSYRNKKTLFILERDQNYRDQYGAMPTFRDAFYSSVDRHVDGLLFRRDEYNIAIHIRRGDIADTQGHQKDGLEHRWQGLEYFEKILAAIVVGAKTERPLKILVFSQGEPDYYAPLCRFANVSLCLDMDARSSFLHMVHADILVTSKSSFSYKPALLSKGIKICPPDFWHGYPTSPDWIIAKRDGTFNLSLLERANEHK